MLNEFRLYPNQYLSQEIKSFYHTGYLGFKKPGNPNFLNTLKNTYGDFRKDSLDYAAQELKNILSKDIPQILEESSYPAMTVCVVPRAKSESSYSLSQLLFKKTVYEVCESLPVINGVDYILRSTNTRTTHLPPNTPNYNNDGDMPYPGITLDTCTISKNIQSCNILLIDDIYTRNVNIDEDMIQALLVSGATSVSFYAVGKTGG